MKVLLVKPYSDFPTRIPPLGLGYLATALLRHGHGVRIADCPREGIDRDGVLALIREYEPGLIGFSAFSADLPVLRSLCGDIRAAHPERPIVLGGPHPSCLPEHSLEYIPVADFVLGGEAESSLPALVGGLEGGRFDPASIPGLAWREDGGIRRTPGRWEEDLDRLGLPAWELLRLDLQEIVPHGAFVRRMPVAPILTTRGCPFPCTFCAARTLSGCALRSRSLDHVMEEVDLLVRRWGIRELHIEDDNFTFHKEYAAGFCEALLARGYDLSWCCPNGVRIDTLDRELLALMKRAGCYSLSLGLESGSDRILKLVRKGLTREKIRDRVRRIREAGIKSTGFFIIGFPGETEIEIGETIRFARSLPLDRAQFSTFLPLPGTPFFQDYLRQQPLEEIPWQDFFTTEVLAVPGALPPQRMVALQRRAFLSFYLRPGILLGLAGEIRSPRHLLHLLRRAEAIFR
jgi:anaerobic magnesium-protoporphyrin IX monomethyl ester cyclase